MTCSNRLGATIVERSERVATVPRPSRAARPMEALSSVPFPMNSECLHGVPKRKRVTECRISLTFREIVTK